MINYLILNALLVISLTVNQPIKSLSQIEKKECAQSILCFNEMLPLEEILQVNGSSDKKIILYFTG